METLAVRSRETTLIVSGWIPTPSNIQQYFTWSSSSSKCNKSVSCFSFAICMVTAAKRTCSCMETQTRMMLRSKRRSSHSCLKKQLISSISLTVPFQSKKAKKERDVLSDGKNWASRIATRWNRLSAAVTLASIKTYTSTRICFSLSGRSFAKRFSSTPSLIKIASDRY